MATSLFIPTATICGACGGDGEVLVSLLPETWQACESCNGTGWVDRPEAEPLPESDDWERFDGVVL